MATPTRSEIQDRAEEIYMAEAAQNPDSAGTRPEPEELVEGGYYDRAQRELMSRASGPNYGEKVQIRGRIQERKEEIRQMREALGYKPRTRKVKVAQVPTVAMSPTPSTQPKGPGRFSRFRGRVKAEFGSKVRTIPVPIKKVPSSAVKSIKSSYQAYKHAKAEERARIAKARVERQVMRAKESHFMMESFQKGRKRGMGEVAYYAGRRSGRALAGRPPPPPPLTVRSALEAGAAHMSGIGISELIGTGRTSLLSGGGYLAAPRGSSASELTGSGELLSGYSRSPQRRPSRRLRSVRREPSLLSSVMGGGDDELGFLSGRPSNGKRRKTDLEELLGL